MARKTKMGKRPKRLKTRRAIEAKLEMVEQIRGSKMSAKPTRKQQMDFMEASGYCAALRWVLGITE